MTMRVKITNLGPEQYVAVVTSVDQAVDVPVTELKIGESAEVHIWPGRHLEVREK